MQYFLDELQICNITINSKQADIGGKIGLIGENSISYAKRVYTKEYQTFAINI